MKKQIQESGTNESLFICLEIDYTIHELCKGFVDMRMVKEEENQAHITVFYSPKVLGISPEKMFDAVKESIPEGFIPGFSTAGMEVFEGVDEGTRDCLVVRMQPSDEMKEWQNSIKNKLIESGATEVELTYPDWKPHMTLGYFEVGEAPELPENFPIVFIPVDGSYIQYGGSESGCKTELGIKNK
jgi:2'-5' RNA ligase